MTFSSLLSIRSHPVRVRGLKHAQGHEAEANAESHPVRVRGLKHGQRQCSRKIGQSHPVRVRGLKHNLQIQNVNLDCRTPCGCVD